MRPNLIFILFFTLVIFVRCINENVEEKYIPANIEVKDRGEIAWFPLNGNLNDSTGNLTMISSAGELNFTKGINNQFGKGVLLNGIDNYITISPGYLDTIAILFWIKTPIGISSPNRPVVFDYGNNAISASLVDGTTGATELVLKNKECQTNFSELGEESYLNTFNKYSLIYIESGGDSTSFTFKGYLNDGKSKVVTGHYKFPSIIDPATEMIYIGRSSLKNEIANSFYKGSIDEIHIFNRFLTQKELEYYLTIQPN